MAGGVGSRFWPFSRNEKPKQFLDFFGTGRSLLQMTIDRFRPLVPIENILIVTNVIYREQVLEQIPICSLVKCCVSLHVGTQHLVLHMQWHVSRLWCRKPKAVTPISW